MKKTAALLISLFAFVNLHAQKLPNIQHASISAPANVKIDGKANEWGEMKAYNKNVDLFYTLANDNSNLYMVIKATDKKVIYKIVNGGISFTINSSGKKEDNGKTITYPKFESNNYPSINLDNKPATKKGVAATAMQIDSFKNAISKNLNERAKIIGLSTAKSESESLTSIYNDLGIKVAQNFDNELAYVYELSIPLTYFESTINDTIAYNIKLNGIYANLPKGAVITTIVGGDAVLNAMNPTDFWGEYTLAK